MRNYYAKLWDCGRGAVYANNGKNRVLVYGFESQAARAAALANYSPPSNCPTASIEPVTAKDLDVRRAMRDQAKIDGGDSACRGYGILGWD